MSIILGIDPGATTGWCIYDSKERHAVASGEFPSNTGPAPIGAVVGEYGRDEIDAVVIESMREPRGNIYPQTVVAAIYEGELTQAVRQIGLIHYCISRHDVKVRLTEATLRTVVCKDDKTVWAALKLLHGNICDKKGGALHGVKSHARAALAAAVAFTLPAETNEAKA